MVEVQRVNKKRWQFILLLSLLLPLGIGLLCLMPKSQQKVDTTSQLQADAAQAKPVVAKGTDFNGLPSRQFPPGYEQKGSVDDRYIMAVDPETGETIINDALGGVGTNNTSVEGDRAQLAKDMISLEQYANHNQGKLKPEDYSWLKKMSRTGMRLAFGTPGLPPAAQLPIKQGLLSDFHNISANPTESLMHTKIYLSAENAAQAAENGYQAMADQAAGVSTSSSGLASPFLAVDPLSVTAGGTWTDPTVLSNQLPVTSILTASSTSTVGIQDYGTFAAVTGAPISTSTTSTTTTYVPVSSVTTTSVGTSNTTSVLTDAQAAQTTITDTSTPIISNTIDLTTSTATTLTNSVISPTTATVSNVISPLTTTSTSVNTTSATTVSTTSAPITVQDYYNTLLGPVK